MINIYTTCYFSDSFRYSYLFILLMLFSGGNISLHVSDRCPASMTLKKRNIRISNFSCDNTFFNLSELAPYFPKGWDLYLIRSFYHSWEFRGKNNILIVWHFPENNYAMFQSITLCKMVYDKSTCMLNIIKGVTPVSTVRPEWAEYRYNVSYGIGST